MAISRPTMKVNPVRALAAKFTNHERRIRRLELRRPVGGGDGALGPAVKVQRATSSQSIPDSAGTNIEFDTVILDTSGGSMWSAADPQSLVAPVDGLYVFHAAWQLEDAAGADIDTTAFADAQVFYGPTSLIQEDIGGKDIQGLTYARGIHGSVYLTATDTIRLDLYQESGVDWKTTHNAGFPLQSIGRGPVFSMARVG